jgi:hypothetical protein
MLVKLEWSKPLRFAPSQTGSVAGLCCGMRGPYRGPYPGARSARRDRKEEVRKHQTHFVDFAKPFEAPDRSKPSETPVAVLPTV